MTRASVVCHTQSSIRPRSTVLGVLIVLLTLAARLSTAGQAAPGGVGTVTPRLVVTSDGHLVVTDGIAVLGSVLISITATDFNTGHADQEANATQVRQQTVDGRRIIDGIIEVPGSNGEHMEFHEEVAPVNGLELRLTYRCKFLEAVNIFGYYIAFQFQIAPLIGQSMHLETGSPKTVTTGPNAPAVADALYHVGQAGELQVAPDFPAGFTITPSEEMHLLMQDNRAWGGDIIEARYHFRNAEQRQAVPAGDTVERTFTVRYNRPMKFILNEGEGDSTDTRGWVPYSISRDKPAFDLSFLNDKPAGKHGFVHVSGGRFAFEDGTRARFWGTSLAGSSAFPTRAESETTARRLAAYGVNLVRIVGTLTGGESPVVASWSGDTPQLDVKTLARLDDLIASLKHEGIYVCLDQYLIPAGHLGRMAKTSNPYAYFDSATVARNRALLRALWSHVNSRTGLAYRDEPAIALLEFINPCDLFTHQVITEPDRGLLEERYRVWAARNSVELNARPVDFAVPSPPITRFLMELQRDYYRGMVQAARAAGVRIPLAGSNWGLSGPELMSLSSLDYIATHAAWDHPVMEVGGDPIPLVKSPAACLG